jgi:hypothetical protein
MGSLQDALRRVQALWAGRQEPVRDDAGRVARIASARSASSKSTEPHGGLLPEYASQSGARQCSRNASLLPRGISLGPGFRTAPGCHAPSSPPNNASGDTVSVTHHRQERFGPARIYLMAHSGGRLSVFRPCHGSRSSTPVVSVDRAPRGSVGLGRTEPPECFGVWCPYGLAGALERDGRSGSFSRRAPVATRVQGSECGPGR